MWPDLLINENKKAFVLHLYTQLCTRLWTNINWPIFPWGFSVPIQTNTVNKYNVLKKSQVAGVRPVGYSQSRAMELNSREPRTNPVSSMMTFGPFSHVNISSKKAFVSKCFFAIFPCFECFEIWSPKLALTILFFSLGKSRWTVLISSELALIKRRFIWDSLRAVFLKSIQSWENNRASSNFYAFLVLSKLLACFISPSSRAGLWTNY